MSDDIVKFTWNEMEAFHRDVAKKISCENFKPNIIIGILRCAMVPATHLAYILGVNELGSIYVRTTPDDSILVEKTIDPKVVISYPLENVNKKNVLLVDTVMASGTSVKLSLDKISSYNPSIIKTAIIVDWPNSPYSLKNEDRPIPDFIGTSVDKWPDFPWES